MSTERDQLVINNLQTVFFLSNFSSHCTFIHHCRQPLLKPSRWLNTNPLPPPLNSSGPSGNFIVCFYIFFIPFHFALRNLLFFNFSSRCAIVENESLSTSNFYHKYLLHLGIYVAFYWNCLLFFSPLPITFINRNPKKTSIRIQFLMKCIYAISLIANAREYFDFNQDKSNWKLFFHVDVNFFIRI